MDNTFESLIESYGLTAYVPSIYAASKTSLRISLKPTSNNPLTSRIGGAPLLPRGAIWPVTSHGKPLGFLAQINLSDLLHSPIALPSSGILSFFYDTANQPWGFFEDAGSWRVLYSPADTSLQLTPQPDETYQPILPSHDIAFVVEQTIPAPRSIELEGLTIAENVELWDAYFDFRDAWVFRNESKVAHRLFGHPDAIQGCMQRKIQFESRGEKLPEGVYSYYDHPRASELMPGAHDWRLLLQLDSDDRLNILWGDSGRLFFWITEDAIHDGRWEEAWANLQCY
jgi:uncharacterized protein YwqG